MSRYPKGTLSCIGTTQLYTRNPFVVAWWSAAFPGFGHMLLNMHLKGNIFFLFEIVINVNAHLNLAMVDTFCGNFSLAKDTLNTRWCLLYIPFYIFCIWDSYRSAVEINKLDYLSTNEPLDIQPVSLTNYETCFLDKRVPITAAMFSLFMPGLGQIYVRRTIPAIAILAWTLVITFYSRDLESLSLLFSWNVEEAKTVLDMEWLLFFPSLIFGASYDAYVSVFEQNDLFILAQRHYLLKQWQPKGFTVNLFARNEDK
ncbi:MAG: hypothetical protein ABF608_04995 [Sporolactobacillus sp.]